MHDPKHVVYEVRLPIPVRKKWRDAKHGEPRWTLGISRRTNAENVGERVYPWWNPKGYSPRVAGRAFESMRLVTIWHDEPGGADSGTVCSYAAAKRHPQHWTLQWLERAQGRTTRGPAMTAPEPTRPADEHTGTVALDLDAARAMLNAANTIKATGGAVEIGGVRIEPCDEYGSTVTTARAESAEAEVGTLRDTLARRTDSHTQLVRENETLRAKVAAVEALADQWADRKRSDGMSGNAWIGITLAGVAADLRAALATTGEGKHVAREVFTAEGIANSSDYGTGYQDGQSDELASIADTCCGKCPGGTCYVDQVTGA